VALATELKDGFGTSLPDLNHKEVPLFIRDYAATLATAVKKRFWGPLPPSLTPKAPFFSKAINIAIGMKAQ